MDLNWDTDTYIYVSAGGVRNFVRDNKCLRCSYKVTETWVLRHSPGSDPPQGTWRYYCLGDKDHDCTTGPGPVAAKIAA